MSAKTLSAQLPNFGEVSPLIRNLRRAGRWLAGRFAQSPASAQRALVVEERVAIGPKKALMVVRCHGQRFLVGTAGDAIGPVIEIAGPKPARARRRPTA